MSSDDLRNTKAKAERPLAKAVIKARQTHSITSDRLGTTINRVKQKTAKADTRATLRSNRASNNYNSATKEALIPDAANTARAGQRAAKSGSVYAYTQNEAKQPNAAAAARLSQSHGMSKDGLGIIKAEAAKPNAAQDVRSAQRSRITGNDLQSTRNVALQPGAASTAKAGQAAKYAKSLRSNITDTAALPRAAAVEVSSQNASLASNTLRTAVSKAQLPLAPTVAVNAQRNSIQQNKNSLAQGKVDAKTLVERRTLENKNKIAKQEYDSKILKLKNRYGEGTAKFKEIAARYQARFDAKVGKRINEAVKDPEVVAQYAYKKLFGSPSKSGSGTGGTGGSTANGGRDPQTGLTVSKGKLYSSAGVALDIKGGGSSQVASIVDTMANSIAKSAAGKNVQVNLNSRKTLDYVKAKLDTFGRPELTRAVTAAWSKKHGGQIAEETSKKNTFRNLNRTFKTVSATLKKGAHADTVTGATHVDYAFGDADNGRLFLPNADGTFTTKSTKVSPEVMQAVQQAVTSLIQEDKDWYRLGDFEKDDFATVMKDAYTEATRLELLLKGKSNKKNGKGQVVLPPGRIGL